MKTLSQIRLETISQMTAKEVKQEIKGLEKAKAKAMGGRMDRDALAVCDSITEELVACFERLDELEA